MVVLKIAQQPHPMICIFVIKQVGGILPAKTLTDKYNKKFIEHGFYIQSYGVDPDKIEQWHW